MDVLVKKLSENFPTNEIIFFRCVFGLLPVTLMVYLTKSSIKTSKITPHIFRPIAASMVMFAFFKSFHLLPLAEVSSISFASIMVTTMLAIYLVKRKSSHRKVSSYPYWFHWNYDNFKAWLINI